VFAGFEKSKLAPRAGLEPAMKSFTPYSNALGPLHSIQKNAEAIPIIPPGLSSPPWMLRPTDEALRMWHQGKNATGSIADASYIVN
jgi:hypothetical protein